MELDKLAASFVTQYYEGLLLQPKDLQACYGPDSTMCVSYANGASEAAQGPEEVVTQLLNLCADLPEAKKLQVQHAEIFPSFENSSLIIIEGVVLSPESHQDFTHTVILRNNGIEGEFYIRNDVWRFAEPVSTVVVAPVTQAAVVAPVAVYQQPAAVAVPVAVAPVEEVAQEEVVIEEEEVAEEEVQSTKAESVVAESPSKQSASPSETEEASPSKSPAKSPGKAAKAPVVEAKPEPKGPINWATKARAAPAADAKTAAPQRVAPPVVAAVEEKAAPTKVAASFKKGDDHKDAKHDAGAKRPARQEAQSFLVLKVRDVEEDDVRAAIPAILTKGIISLRNKSHETSRVFVDFVNPNAMEIMKNPELRIGGKPFTVELQKKRD